MKELVGPRIALRPYLESDIPHIHEWSNDPETTKWMGPRFRNGRTLEEVTAGVARLIALPPDDGVFFVISDSTGAYLGAIDLTSIDWFAKNGVLSIVIAKESDRGKGWGQEAVRLLASHAFESLGLHKIELSVAADNAGAVRCYEKIGFVLEGRIRDHLLVDSRYRDLLKMGLIRGQ